MKSLLIFISALLIVTAVKDVSAQRDHLTENEVTLVKDSQILDKRVDVFIKAAERRMMLILGSVEANTKQLKKDSELWGDLPPGSRADLMSDIAKIFEEAITNIDDVSSRDEKNPLIAKSVRKLSAAATKIVEQLKPLNKTGAEINSFELIVENADSLTQAAGKLPPEVAKKGKSKDKPKEVN